jgi:hypothetical protein
MQATCSLIFKALLISFIVFVIAFGTPLLSRYASGQVLEMAGCSKSGFDTPAVCPKESFANRFVPLEGWLSSFFAPIILIEDFGDVLLGWIVLIIIFGIFAAQSKNSSTKP